MFSLITNLSLQRCKDLLKKKLAIVTTFKANKEPIAHGLKRIWITDFIILTKIYYPWSNYKDGSAVLRPDGTPEDEKDQYADNAYTVYGSLSWMLLLRHDEKKSARRGRLKWLGEDTYSVNIGRHPRDDREGS